MKKKLIALLVAGTLIWVGAMWYDVPVKKEIRGYINWSNYNH